MCEDECECSETEICWACLEEDEEDDGPYDTWQEWELDNE